MNAGKRCRTAVRGYLKGRLFPLNRTTFGCIGFLWQYRDRVGSSVVLLVPAAPVAALLRNRRPVEKRLDQQVYRAVPVNVRSPRLAVPEADRDERRPVVVIRSVRREKIGRASCRERVCQNV